MTQADLNEMKRELKELKKENEVLKKKMRNYQFEKDIGAAILGLLVILMSLGIFADISGIVNFGIFPQVIDVTLEKSMWIGVSVIAPALIGGALFGSGLVESVEEKRKTLAERIMS